MRPPTLLLVLLAGLTGACTRFDTVPLPRAVPPSVDVPEWAKDAVWYQIFPERFRNGDPSNDPTVDDLRGSWPHLTPEGWQIARWTADWYARAGWERAASDDFYLSVQLRRYGGDLQGILDRLDYLDSLGVTALYLNPIFESPSLHKYDGAMYHHVDDNFGPDPAGDRARMAAENPVDPATWTWTAADTLFLALVREAHARGMRVILDGVFNHMGLRSFAFEDVVARQQASPFADWFTITAWDDPATPDTNEFAYAGWLGVRELPELREDEHGLIPPIRAYVYASVRRWMDPNGDGDPSDGVDGWRLDVAEMVHLRFWQDFRAFVRGLNPEAYLVGEVWWEEWPERMFNARPWLEGDAFDAVMNYRWARAVRRLFLGADLEPGAPYGPSAFARELRTLYEDYPPEVNFVLMNTLGSHDTDRLASQVVNPDVRFDYRAGVRDNPAYRVRKPNAAERTTQRLILAHQFTYVGAPHLFYGDEAGMWGADDPDDRKPMVWPELTFDDEASHPLGLERPRDAVGFDHDLFAYYRTLVHLRRASPALRRGSFEVLHADDATRTLAYARRFGDEQVWVAFNLDEAPHELALDVQTTFPAAGHTPARSLVGRTVRDVLSGETARLERATLTFPMPPRSARIWMMEE
ncbi:glycoside hydrolase family 13 protein [Rhodocaloribacter litoris]|uniref:glycoside hydrolase family 13 protein n=1 Tax=Rhodocaloribacter litoris TaxID=2558931 RepID=UPI0014208018|nr:glycoside hydrolase family 13 protein [Rhodocaloribacter litoris]QXD16745.1 glycoside hydrolase family 13 protein [Rhodocaloribacter litoris]